MVQDSRDGIEQLEKDMTFLEGHAVRVGWLSAPEPESIGKGRGSDKKRDDDGKSQEVTVARVARAHELSLGNLEGVQPPRSVIIATMERDTVQVEELVGEAMDTVLTGAIDAETGLKFVGAGTQDLVKRRYVTQKGFVPLSEKRKAEKVRGGKPGDKARINTAQELNSVRYQIARI